MRTRLAQLSLAAAIGAAALVASSAPAHALTIHAPSMFSVHCTSRYQLIILGDGWGYNCGSGDYEIADN